MNKFLLYTGADIPFCDSFVIHQPRLWEISSIADDSDFFKICRLYCIKKEDLVEEVEAEQITNYKLFLSVLADPKTPQKDKDLIIKILELFFSGQVSFTKAGLVITKEEDNFLLLNDDNFLNFQKIVKQVVGLAILFEEEEEFNPVGAKAKEIAEKLKRGRKRVAEVRAKENKQKSFLGNYMTILIVGCHLSFEDINKMTIPQLLYAVERYVDYFNFDIDFRSRMVGGGDKNSSPKNWMEFR